MISFASTTSSEYPASYVQDRIYYLTDTGTIKLNGVTYGSGGGDVSGKLDKKLAITESSEAELSLSPACAYKWTLSEDGTLSLDANWESGKASEALIDILPESYSVTCSGSIELADALTASKVNHCVVRWDGTFARLYVVDMEDLGTIAPTTAYIDGVVNTAIAYSLADDIAASNEAPVTFQVASGTLPDGLTMGSDGYIEGTPTTAGTTTVTLTATARNCPAATVTLTFTITSGGGATVTASSFAETKGDWAGGLQAALQTYTYTGNFTVAGETFPYYTGNGATTWYLFGGKTSAGHYVWYLSSHNPTTDIASWAATASNNYLTMEDATATNNTRIYVSTKSSSNPWLTDLTYADVTGDFDVTTWSAYANWMWTNDTDYSYTRSKITFV